MYRSMKYHLKDLQVFARVAVLLLEVHTAGLSPMNFKSKATVYALKTCKSLFILTIASHLAAIT
jgi:hypothetical protein